MSNHDQDHDPKRPAGTTTTTETGELIDRSRRAHLAVVDPQAGKVGSPTPSERRQVYAKLLREGGPPAGWPTRQAKLWGVHHSLVTSELAEARAEHEASYGPDVAMREARDLIRTAAEISDHMHKLAGASIVGKDDSSDMVVAKAKALEARVKALAAVANIKLKASGELRQLYRPASGQPGQASPPPHDVGAALKQGMPPQR